ncbi:MAG: FadR family transcriptional regulator, partial [Methylobacteriaceae bacterium]|nr:FadR family transcriptional regulator [Methylobacteriaceae bacterium]
MRKGRAVGGSSAGLRGRITSAIAQRILSGLYPAGSVLPAEAEFGAEFGASRTALREAMRVLAAKGLVEPRQRVGTIVRAEEEWNRLDPDVLAWMDGVAPDLGFIRGLIEARLVIEPVAAELAARRATGRDLSAIESAYERMCRSHPHDLEACTAADLEFHLAIIRATKNPVFANLGSIIGAALSSSFRLTTSLTHSY